MFLEAKSIYGYVKFIPLSPISYHSYLPNFILEPIQSTSPKDPWLIKIQVSAFTKSPLLQVTQPVEIQVCAPVSAPIMTIGQKKTKSIVSTSQSPPLLISNNNNNNVELVREVRIKANRRIFNSIAVANNYVKTFTFGENYFQS